jgi:hypothetical protein
MCIRIMVDKTIPTIKIWAASLERGLDDSERDR